jgi:hypothetical protein
LDAALTKMASRSIEKPQTPQMPPNAVVMAARA